MIIIMGPVGSGKSEQTARLMARRKIDAVSTSQILRDNLTPERKSQMLAGDLVDDQEIIDLVQPELAKKQAAGQDFILDGFPRSRTQAQWLVDQVHEGKVKLLAIIKLDVSNQTVLKRLLARGRVDDTQEIIQHRLETYYATTDPVFNYLRQEGLPVHEIDGEQAPEIIAEEINRILDEAKDR